MNGCATVTNTAVCFLPVRCSRFMCQVCRTRDKTTKCSSISDVTILKNMPKLYLCGRDNTEQQTRAKLMSVNIHSQFIVLLLENVNPSHKIHTFPCLLLFLFLPLNKYFSKRLVKQYQEKHPLPAHTVFKNEGSVQETTKIIAAARVNMTFL